MTQKFPRVAYFSMEVALDQALKTYAGGLGFLAGSHLRSAHELGHPMVGVSILWSYGYYDQVLGHEGDVTVKRIRKHYHFLKDPGILVPVTIRGQRVLVKAFLVEPQVFGAVPVYLLTTDIPQNPTPARSITHSLYDADEVIRLAQEIVLGRGGCRVLEAAGEHIDLYHMNEGHALPLAFELLNRTGSLPEVRKRLVFTTHTPIKAGNEVHDVDLMSEMGFFGPGVGREAASELGGFAFSLTAAALRMSKRANAVSQRHGEVANEMWAHVNDRCPIIAITNAQSRSYWQDPALASALAREDMPGLLARKREMKTELFRRIADESGKLFDPDVCTVVWARRFADYKRAWMPLKDKPWLERLLREKRMQIVWSGKPHPNDTGACELINWVQTEVRDLPGAALVTGYELNLSRQLKFAADVWLNTPRRPKEASGTSGMSAAMNGAIHVSTQDGWHLEYADEGVNSFSIGGTGPTDEETDDEDHASMCRILEHEVLPRFADRERWASTMAAAMRSVVPFFDSHRMVEEYQTRLYAD